MVHKMNAQKTYIYFCPVHLQRPDQCSIQKTGGKHLTACCRHLWASILVPVADVFGVLRVVLRKRPATRKLPVPDADHVRYVPLPEEKCIGNFKSTVPPNHTLRSCQGQGQWGNPTPRKAALNKIPPSGGGGCDFGDQIMYPPLFRKKYGTQRGKTTDLPDDVPALEGTDFGT